jgi:hypothetical protein
VLREEKVPVINKGVDLSVKKYKLVKQILRKGIKVNYSIMLKLKKFIQFSTIDSIDKGRANSVYFRFLRSMGMFNRFAGLERWMLDSNWSCDCVKRVKQRHYMGNNFNSKMVSSKRHESLAVVVHDNPNYEIIKEMEITKLNKAVRYLKWVRNRFRMDSCNIDSADILDLNLWKQSFGCQRSENKFIIWK